MLTARSQITAVMDGFEKNFNDLDVIDEYTREATSSTNAVQVPQDEVDRMMAQAADKAGVELNQDLNEATPAQGKIAQPDAEHEGLSERLRALRN
jgi:charged multivesicular body protein 1